MSPADRWTLADVAEHYARHPELRHPEPSIMPLAQPTDGYGETLAQTRSAGRAKAGGLLGASGRQRHASLAAHVALVAWRATVAILPPVTALCGDCQKTTQHRCTLWGWVCGGCGVERIHEEFEGRPVCLAGPSGG